MKRYCSRCLGAELRGGTSGDPRVGKFYRCLNDECDSHMQRVETVDWPGWANG